MSLVGGKVICIGEDGVRGEECEAKGRTFTFGYFINSDFSLKDSRAKGEHCTIECDAFGRITLHNKSEEYPVHVNGHCIAIKTDLCNGARIKILDKEFIWDFNRTNAETPLKHMPAQHPNSMPDLRFYRSKPPRYTVHKFSYGIAHNEEGNSSLDSDSSKTELQSENMSSSQQLVHNTSLPNISGKPFAQVIFKTPDKTTKSIAKDHSVLKSLNRSDVVYTSYTNVSQGSFISANDPTTPKSTYSTPLSRLSGSCSSMHMIDFTNSCTTSVQKRPISKSRLQSTGNLTPKNRYGELGVCALPRTPGYLGTHVERTASSEELAISVNSSDRSSVIECGDEEPASIGKKSMITPTKQSINVGHSRTQATPFRTPQSLMKRALLKSAQKKGMTPLRSPNVNTSSAVQNERALLTPERAKNASFRLSSVVTPKNASARVPSPARQLGFNASATKNRNETPVAKTPATAFGSGSIKHSSTPTTAASNKSLMASNKSRNIQQPASPDYVRLSKARRQIPTPKRSPPSSAVLVSKPRKSICSPLRSNLSRVEFLDLSASTSKSAIAPTVRTAICERNLTVNSTPRSILEKFQLRSRSSSPVIRQTDNVVCGQALTESTLKADNSHQDQSVNITENLKPKDATFSPIKDKVSSTTLNETFSLDKTGNEKDNDVIMLENELEPTVNVDNKAMIASTTNLCETPIVKSECEISAGGEIGKDIVILETDGAINQTNKSTSESLMKDVSNMSEKERETYELLKEIDLVLSRPSDILNISSKSTKRSYSENSLTPVVKTEAINIKEGDEKNESVLSDFSDADYKLSDNDFDSDNDIMKLEALPKDATDLVSAKETIKQAQEIDKKELDIEKDKQFEVDLEEKLITTSTENPKMLELPLADETVVLTTEHTKDNTVTDNEALNKTVNYTKEELSPNDVVLELVDGTKMDIIVNAQDIPSSTGLDTSEVIKTIETIIEKICEGEKTHPFNDESEISTSEDKVVSDERNEDTSLELADECEISTSSNDDGKHELKLSENENLDLTSSDEQISSAIGNELDNSFVTEEEILPFDDVIKGYNENIDNYQKDDSVTNIKDGADEDDDDDDDVVFVASYKNPQMVTVNNANSKPFNRERSSAQETEELSDSDKNEESFLGPDEAEKEESDLFEILFQNHTEDEQDCALNASATAVSDEDIVCKESSEEEEEEEEKENKMSLENDSKQEQTHLNDYNNRTPNLRGIRAMLRTPKVKEVATPNFVGLQNLLRTPPKCAEDNGISKEESGKTPLTTRTLKRKTRTNSVDEINQLTPRRMRTRSYSTSMEEVEPNTDVAVSILVPILETNVEEIQDNEKTISTGSVTKDQVKGSESENSDLILATDANGVLEGVTVIEITAPDSKGSQERAKEILQHPLSTANIMLETDAIASCSTSSKLQHMRGLCATPTAHLNITVAQCHSAVEKRLSKSVSGESNFALNETIELNEKATEECTQTIICETPALVSKCKSSIFNSNVPPSNEISLNECHESTFLESLIVTSSDSEVELIPDVTTRKTKQEKRNYSTTNADNKSINILTAGEVELNINDDDGAIDSSQHYEISEDDKAEDTALYDVTEDTNLIAEKNESESKETSEEVISTLDLEAVEITKNEEIIIEDHKNDSNENTLSKVEENGELESFKNEELTAESGNEKDTSLSENEKLFVTDSEVVSSDDEIILPTQEVKKVTPSDDTTNIENTTEQSEKMTESEVVSSHDEVEQLIEEDEVMTVEELKTAVEESFEVYDGCEEIAEVNQNENEYAQEASVESDNVQIISLPDENSVKITNEGNIDHHTNDIPIDEINEDSIPEKDELSILSSEPPINLPKGIEAVEEGTDEINISLTIEQRSADPENELSSSLADEDEILPSNTTELEAMNNDEQISSSENNVPELKIQSSYKPKDSQDGEHLSSDISAQIPIHSTGFENMIEEHADIEEHKVNEEKTVISTDRPAECKESTESSKEDKISTLPTDNILSDLEFELSAEQKQLTINERPIAKRETRSNSVDEVTRMMPTRGRTRNYSTSTGDAVGEVVVQTNLVTILEANTECIEKEEDNTKAIEFEDSETRVEVDEAENDGTDLEREELGIDAVLEDQVSQEDVLEPNNTPEMDILETDTALEKQTSSSVNVSHENVVEDNTLNTSTTIPTISAVDTKTKDKKNSCLEKESNLASDEHISPNSNQSVTKATHIDHAEDMREDAATNNEKVELSEGIDLPEDFISNNTTKLIADQNEIEKQSAEMSNIYNSQSVINPKAKASSRTLRTRKQSATPKENNDMVYIEESKPIDIEPIKGKDDGFNTEKGSVQIIAEQTLSNATYITSPIADSTTSQAEAKGTDQIETAHVFCTPTADVVKGHEVDDSITKSKRIRKPSAKVLQMDLLSLYDSPRRRQKTPKAKTADTTAKGKASPKDTKLVTNENHVSPMKVNERQLVPDTEVDKPTDMTLQEPQNVNSRTAKRNAKGKEQSASTSRTTRRKNDNKTEPNEQVEQSLKVLTPPGTIDGKSDEVQEVEHSATQKPTTQRSLRKGRKIDYAELNHPVPLKISSNVKGKEEQKAIQSIDDESVEAAVSNNESPAMSRTTRRKVAGSRKEQRDALQNQLSVAPPIGESIGEAAIKATDVPAENKKVSKTRATRRNVKADLTTKETESEDAISNSTLTELKEEVQPIAMPAKPEEVPKSRVAKRTAKGGRKKAVTNIDETGNENLPVVGLPPDKSSEQPQKSRPTRRNVRGGRKMEGSESNGSPDKSPKLSAEESIKVPEKLVEESSLPLKARSSRRNAKTVRDNETTALDLESSPKKSSDKNVNASELTTDHDNIAATSKTKGNSKSRTTKRNAKAHQENEKETDQTSNQKSSKTQESGALETKEGTGEATEAVIPKKRSRRVAKTETYDAEKLVESTASAEMETEVSTTQKNTRSAPKRERTGKVKGKRSPTETLLQSLSSETAKDIPDVSAAEEKDSTETPEPTKRTRKAKTVAAPTSQSPQGGRPSEESAIIDAPKPLAPDVPQKRAASRRRVRFEPPYEASPVTTSAIVGDTDMAPLKRSSRRKLK